MVKKYGTALANYLIRARATSSETRNMSSNNALILKNETVYKLHAEGEGKPEALPFFLLIKQKKFNQSSP